MGHKDWNKQVLNRQCVWCEHRGAGPQRHLRTGSSQESQQSLRCSEVQGLGASRTGQCCCPTCLSLPQRRPLLVAASAEGSWEPLLSRRLWPVENWQVIPLPAHRGSCLWLWPSCPCSRAMPTPGEGNRGRTDRGEVTTSSLCEALCQGGALAVLRANSRHSPP